MVAKILVKFSGPNHIFKMVKLGTLWILNALGKRMQCSKAKRMQTLTV